MAKILLDSMYLYTKNKINTIFKKSFLLNIINDESNNMKSKRIFNIIVFTKNHKTFYAYSESAIDK